MSLRLRVTTNAYRLPDSSWSNCDADVSVREDEQGVFAVLHVHVAVAHQRLRGQLRQDVGDRDAHVGIELTLLRHELVRAGHVDVHGQLKSRDSPGLREPARDRLADLRERTRLDLARRSLSL